MARQEKIFKNLNASFLDRGGRLHVLDHRVPIEQQLEYFKYAQKVRKAMKNRKEIDYNQCQINLESIDLPNKVKKMALSVLASSSEIRAYRLIEQYMQHPDEELINWASMALIECRMALESELTGEKQIFISTGLGGKGEKFRFYVLIPSSQGVSFALYQREVIEKEVGYLMPQYECEVERLTIQDNYVELVFLLPVSVDIRKIVEKLIVECNLYGNFLSEMHVVTNVKELSQNEINQVIIKTRKNFEPGSR